MKKKAESRLEPFFRANLKEEELKSMIAALSPTDLGEIRNLLGLKIQEMKEQLPELKKRLEQAECPPKVLDERLSHGRNCINAVEAVQKKFNDVFLERKQKKQEILS